VAVNDRTRRIIWARAGNECALCGLTLVQRDAVTRKVSVVGEECHIVARSVDGPRGSLEPPGGELDGEQNLVLLCRNDHRRIDENVEDYAVERLLELKRAHEEQVERRRGGRPPPDRLERLAALERRSRARCIDRWLVLGVSMALAEQLADDADVGDEVAQAVAAHAGPVTVLLGEVGVGKSLGGERVHRNAIVQGRVDPDAPAPVWLRGAVAVADLKAAVKAEASSLGVDIERSGVHLVLDGLDEPGPAPAEALLRAARELVLALPRSRAVLTTRLLPEAGAAEERVTAPALSREAAQDLLALAASPRHAHLMRWPDAVQEAARRPAFCLALASAVREDDPIDAEAPAALIAGVVRRALQGSPAADPAVLERLAVAFLRSGAGALRAVDHVTQAELTAALESRLIIEESGWIRFPLILIAQSLAGRALAKAPAIEELLQSTDDLELWRTPLAIAITSGPTATVREIAGILAERSPAVASLVLDESTRQFGRAEETPRDAVLAARELREAMATWIRGLGPLGSRLAPRDGNALPPMAARIDGRRLTALWYRGREPRPPAFQLSDAEYASLATEGHEFGPGSSRAPSGGPAWPWRWTHASLRTELERLLRGRELALGGTPLEAEATWYAAARILGASSAIDVTSLLEPDATVLVGTVYEHARIPLPAPVRAALKRYAMNGVLLEPLPGADRSTHGPYVWSDYSAEAVLRRVEASLTLALAGYEHFSTTIFGRLADRLELAAMLPAVLHARVRAADRHDVSPAITYWFEPLPPDQPSRIDAQLGPLHGHDLFDEMSARITSLRPRAARWLTPATHTSFEVDIFGALPSAQRMYTWLWHDLKAISWVTGSLNDWPVRQIPRLGEEWISGGVLDPRSVHE
jgi:hypothetical protein